MNRLSFAAICLGLVFFVGACSDSLGGEGGDKDIAPDVPVTIPEAPEGRDASDIGDPEDVTQDVIQVETAVDRAPGIVNGLESIQGTYLFVET